MSAPLDATESAIVWAITHHGGPDVTRFLAPLAKVRIDAALGAGTTVVRPTPLQRLHAAIGADRDSVATLRRSLPAHQRGALDRAVANRDAPTALDIATIELFLARYAELSTRNPPHVPTPDELRRVGLLATGIALADLDGRAFARATIGLDDHQRRLVVEGRQQELPDGPAGVVRDAFVRLARATSDLSERADAVALYLLAFVYADAAAASHAALTAALRPSQRAQFHDFLRTAARSSRRAHAPALAMLLRLGADDE